MIDDTKEAAMRTAVETASEEWKTAFNSGDAAGCAAAYEVDAIMVAKPFGTFHGREDIKAFWQKIFSDGFAAVEYLNPEIVVVDEVSALLSSKWKMNNAHGIITKELWVLQGQGILLLREDEFEILG